ncbi:MAG: type II toxin-antitoxin system RelE/ParE family toxin [Bacteroidia bacterium]
MPKFKLSNKAVEDLSKIWDYTFDRWSEKQANNYYNSLIVSCQVIANNPDLGKSYKEIAQCLIKQKCIIRNSQNKWFKLRVKKPQPEG